MDLYWQGNRATIRVCSVCDYGLDEPLATYIGTLQEIVDGSPETVRDTLRVKYDSGYEGDCSVEVWRDASQEEIAAHRLELSESAARDKAAREAGERLEYERLSKKFAA